MKEAHKGKAMHHKAAKKMEHHSKGLHNSMKEAVHHLAELNKHAKHVKNSGKMVSKKHPMK